MKINKKDVLDALILLASHPLAASSDGAGEGSDAKAAINVSRIVALTSADWGWWRRSPATWQGCGCSLTRS